MQANYRPGDVRLDTYPGVVRSPGKALQRLRIAVDDDRLAALCREHRVEPAVLFGSALTSEEPGDVDVAIGLGSA
jgi:hypothetical protein